MSHRRSHFCKVSRSCRRVSESEWLVIVIQIAVSSAKSRTCESMFSGRSLINNKNNKGPSTDPWGTPELTRISDELSPSSTTV